MLHPARPGPTIVGTDTPTEAPDMPDEPRPTPPAADDARKPFAAIARPGEVPPPPAPARILKTVDRGLGGRFRPSTSRKKLT